VKLRPRVQICTVEELLKGRKPSLPPVYDIISAAFAARRAGSRQAPPPTPEVSLYGYEESQAWRRRRSASRAGACPIEIPKSLARSSRPTARSKSNGIVAEPATSRDEHRANVRLPYQLRRPREMRERDATVFITAVAIIFGIVIPIAVVALLLVAAN
jgi:hypothetical protein